MLPLPLGPVERLRECEEAMAAHKARLEEIAGCMPVVDSGFLVLKQVPGKVVEELKKGEFLALGAGVSTSGREGAGFVRCWQGRGRSEWNVVVQVSPSMHQLFLREAQAVRRWCGVVVAPYLTVLGCRLRRERQGVFDGLMARGGLTPRWRKGVQIEFLEAGVWKQYDFGPTG